MSAWTYRHFNGKAAEAQAVATRKKTARLKALRLAKEAQEQTDEPPAKQTKRRTARREK